MTHRYLRVLSGEDVQHALDMRGAIDAMRSAFLQITTGEATVPLRTGMELSHDGSSVLLMPVHLKAADRFGLKMVSIIRQNPSRGLPLIQGVMIVADAGDGTPLALVNAEQLTDIRTGAASGLATALMSRPEARTVVIFGAGRQGRAQLEGVCAVRGLEKAYVVDPSPERSADFCAEMSARLALPVLPGSAHAVREADIICTATTSATPVFVDTELPAGVHINGVGSYHATTREIPGETLRRARVVVDSRAAALAEAGDIVLPIREGLITAAHVTGEIGDILLERIPGRENPAEVTLFKSVGNAAQDLAAASLLLDRASRMELGQLVRL